VRRRFWIVLALGALVVLPAAAGPAGAVVGGRDVAAGDYPWLAVGPGCTGALIAPDRVLTAAHCVRGSSPGRLRWYLGAAPRGRGRALAIAAIASHPGFAPEAGVSGHDVALLRLAQPVADVAPLRVAGAGDAALTEPGTPVQTIGWGATKTAGTPQRPDFAEPSDTPHEGDLAIVSYGACADWYRHAPAEPATIPAGLLCAGSPRVSACVGDSGGPLVARDAAGAWVALGVFSFTQRCGADGDPAAWTDLAAHRAFVTDPDPVWAPVPAGRPRITGTAQAGRVLRCVAPRWIGRADAVRYGWAFAGRMPLSRPAARSGAHRVAGGEAGKPLTCQVEASNAGGFAVTDNAVPVRVIRRR
jgi:secreted trypsin-like serine protease